MFQGMNLWYKTKKNAPLWFKSVCSEWEGVAAGKYIIPIPLGCCRRLLGPLLLL